MGRNKHSQDSFFPKLSLVTGATSGIGWATAHALAACGSDLILTGRRKARLHELAKAIESEFGVKVLSLSFDVSDFAACEKALQGHSALLKRIDLLVNNAGLAKGVHTIQQGSISDWDVMIDTNIKGLLYMTRLVLPYMVKRKAGHVVNLGSVAGRWVYPGGNVYGATKFAVRALTESMRMDLLGTGIRVTNVAPGMVETEFSEVRFGDKKRAKKVYQGFQPLTAQDVAEAIVWCVGRPPHVNIQELIVYPTNQASVQNVHRE